VERVSGVNTPIQDIDVRPAGEQIDRAHVAFLWTGCVLMVLGLWLRPLSSSLTVDEAGTWWVIEGGARQAIQRAEAVQGQSPLYYLLLWAWRHLVGHSELALRLPSLAFSLVSLWLVYLIATRLFDREVGRIAAVAFVAWHQVVFEASDARPYALATMLVAAAAWFLLIWLDAGGLWRGTAFVVVAGLVPYVHPVATPVLLSFFAYAAVRIVDRSTDIRPRHLVLAGCGIAVLMVPVVAEVLVLAGRHGEWNLPATVSVSLVLAMLVPSAFIAVALLVVLLVGVMKVRVRGALIPRAARLLLATWILVPSGALFVLALTSPVQLIAPRYFVVIAPAGAITTAVLIGALEPPRVRRLIVLLLIVLSVVDLSARYKIGDYRGALALVGSEADDRSVTLLGYGFRESLQTDWYGDAQRASLLTAPAAYYPVPGEVLALPTESPMSSVAWTRARVEAVASSTDHVFAVTQTGTMYSLWLGDLLRQRGFDARVVGVVEGLTITEFIRPAS
jgi:uncharacterized membrane protein